MHNFTRTLAAAAAGLAFALAAPAQSYDPKATIADLDARLAKIGAPTIQGTDAVAGKDVPAIYFGDPRSTTTTTWSTRCARRTTPPRRCS